MKTFVCTVCGYVFSGEEPPERCPRCHAPREKFVERADEPDSRVAGPAIGAARGLEEGLLDEVRGVFREECANAASYLAMSRQSGREGLPEVAEAFAREAFGGLARAADLAELLGERVFPDARANLVIRAEAEGVARERSLELSRRARERGHEVVADALLETAEDARRRGEELRGLLARRFGG